MVPPGSEQRFLDPLPVGSVWGIGKISGEVFRGLGIYTIGDLRAHPLEGLQSRFGRHGEHLWRLARGIDERLVIPDHEAKSISHETTFEHDIEEESVLRSWMLDLTEQVGRRLRQQNLRARTVQIKVRFNNFHTITRARSLSQATDITSELWALASELLLSSRKSDPRPVRLLGMGAAGLDDCELVQQDLFDVDTRRKQGKIDSVMDSVTARFGKSALRRGSDPRH